MDSITAFISQNTVSTVLFAFAILDAMLALAMWRRDSRLRARGVPVQGTILDPGQLSDHGPQPTAGYHWQGQDRTLQIGYRRERKQGDPIDLLVDPDSGKAGLPGSKTWMFVALPAVVMFVMGLVLLGR